jgi:ribA/ribD-fused uncharacterized protein
MRVIGNVVAYYSYQDYPSHHYLCNFKVKDVEFSSMEQMLMYSKAMLFQAENIAKDIMATDVCQQQKMLGRRIPWSDDREALWKSKCRKIAFIGNREKYRYNPPLLSLLMMTGESILVEATRKDKIWGAGIDEDDDRIADPLQWKGENLHGEVQMEVRDYFRNHPEAKPLADFAKAYNKDKQAGLI